MDFSKSMAVAAAGMRAQSDRMKMIAENIANANSTSPTPGGDPYRRKIATVTQSFDRELGANLVECRQADGGQERIPQPVRSRQSQCRHPGLCEAAQCRSA